MWGWPWAADRKTSDGQKLFQDPDWARCDGRGPQESALLSHRPPFISHEYLRHNVPRITNIFRWMKISSSVMCHRLSVLHSHYNTEPKENYKDGYLYVGGIFFRALKAENTLKLRQPNSVFVVRLQDESAVSGDDQMRLLWRLCLRDFLVSY